MNFWNAVITKPDIQAHKYINTCIILPENWELYGDIKTESANKDKQIPNLDGQFDLQSDDELNLGKKINILHTIGDMFYDLYDDGHKPTAKNYNEFVSDWLKSRVLSEVQYDCNETEWLNETTSYFCLYAKRIFKQDRNVKRLKFQNKHSAFLNKYLDATDISKCHCVKCLHVKSLKSE